MSYKTVFTVFELLIVVGSGMAQPQPPDTLWTRTFGGSYSDGGKSVQQTSDDGFIIAGWTYSYGAGSRDVYLIKTDGQGNQHWYRTFGGGNYEEGKSVQQTSDGGFIIAGGTYSYGAGDEDVYLIKTDASGNQQWYRTFGGGNGDYGRSVQQASDGGFIIAGGTWSYGAGNADVYLIKTDAQGNEEWYRTFGGGYDDWGESVQQASDGGFIIAGYTYSYGSDYTDVYLIKTDASGNEEWYRTFGGGYDDWGESVQQTSNGGFIIAGGTGSYGAGWDDVYLIKTDASGNEEWYRTFGGGSDDRGYSVRQTSDGGFIIAGTTGSFGADYWDVYLIKTDASGNEEWYRTFGGGYDDWGESVQQASDGGFIIAGKTYSYGAGDADVYLIRLGSETGLDEHNNQHMPNDFTLYPVFPNPFNPTTTITFNLPVASDVSLIVYDISGREVESLVSGHWSLGQHQVDWNAEGLSSGIYFVRLSVDGGQSAVQKMVLMK